MTCRYCKSQSGRMVKYEVRHYAHHACWMKKWGSAGFGMLHLWQLRQFPYLVAKELGLLPALEAMIRLKEAVR